MRRFTAAMLLLLAASLPALAHAEPPARLTIGDAAPPLAVESWLKGEPVTGFARGHVYIVDFWATWCVPCLLGMPDLTALQAEWKDKVTVIGVAVWEGGPANDYSDSTRARVAAVVAEKDQAIGYRIAYDGGAQRMAEGWLRPAGVGFIPNAFIVDGEGRLAAIGNPGQPAFVEGLAAVVEGRHDRDAARAAWEAQREQAVSAGAARRIATARLNAAVDAALPHIRAGRHADGVAVCDTLDGVFAALGPSARDNAKVTACRRLLAAGEVATAHAFIDHLLEADAIRSGLELSEVAWIIANPEAPIVGADPQRAVRCAARALELLTPDEEMGRSMILEVQALSLWLAGEQDRAVATLQEAIRIESHPKLRVLLEQRLAGLAPAQVAAQVPAQAAAQTATQTAAQVASPVAHTFATALLAKDGPTARALTTAEMAGALNDAAIGQLVFAVTAQVGPDLAADTAWREKEADGYEHWRVPLRGGKGVRDFEVVLDGQGRAAGLWLRPHLPTPEEAAAAPEPGAPRELEIAVGPAGSTLPGLLALPEGTGPFPVVVLVHGSGPQDRDVNVMGNRPFHDLAHGLAARGVATVRYDKRSFALPATLQKLGEALTVQHETIDDAVAAVALARTRPELDPARVFVLGHSLGGTAGPRIAAQARADGLIVVAGMARSLPDVVLEQVRHIANADGTLTMDEAISIERMEGQVAQLREAPGTTSFIGLSPAYLADLEAHDAPAAAAALEIPVLVLQGGRDYQVTLADFALWGAALKDCPRACLKVYEKLDHLLRAGEGVSSPEAYGVPGVVDDALIGDVAGFVKEGCGGIRP